METTNDVLLRIEALVVGLRDQVDHLQAQLTDQRNVSSDTQLHVARIEAELVELHLATREHWLDTQVHNPISGFHVVPKQ